MDHCNEKRITYLKYGFISSMRLCDALNMWSWIDVIVDTIPDSLVITEIVLLFQYFLFKREDQALKFFLMIFSFLCIPKKPRENSYPKEQKSDTKHETEHMCKGVHHTIRGDSTSLLVQ